MFWSLPPEAVVRLTRRGAGILSVDRLDPEARAFFETLRSTVPFLEEDIALDTVLNQLVEAIGQQRWSLYQ